MSVLPWSQEQQWNLANTEQFGEWFTLVTEPAVELGQHWVIWWVFYPGHRNSSGTWTTLSNLVTVFYPGHRNSSETWTTLSNLGSFTLVTGPAVELGQHWLIWWVFYHGHRNSSGTWTTLSNVVSILLWTEGQQWNLGQHWVIWCVFSSGHRNSSGTWTTLSNLVGFLLWSQEQQWNLDNTE